MQDLVWLLYIGLWLAAARFASQVRFPVPRVAEVGGAVFVADQRPLGCMVALFCLMGAAVGAFEPTMIYDLFLRSAPLGGPPLPGEGIDPLGRLAQVVGGACGAYVGARAVRLWILLLLGWAALQVFLYVVRR